MSAPGKNTHFLTGMTILSGWGTGSSTAVTIAAGFSTVVIVCSSGSASVAWKYAQFHQR